MCKLDVMASVKTPFCWRLKGPAEVYGCSGDTIHMTQVYRENVTGFMIFDELDCSFTMLGGVKAPASV